MNIETVINVLLFIFPAYVANALPVLLGGGTSMDFGKKFFDKRRIFGDGKTIMGFFAGIFGGITAGGIMSYFILLPFFPNVNVQFLAFALMSTGTMCGDAFGSFLKRRLNIEPGKPFLLDQLMFLIVALVFVIPFASAKVYAVELLAFLFIITYVLHIVSNFVANKFGWKKVPW